jgi:hypothetical protein
MRYLQGWQMTTKRSDFDLDLRYGQVAERSVANILSIETVEVKRDRRWIETGNIYIETACRSQGGEWYYSGINATKATHWALVLEDLTIVVKKSDLLGTVMSYGTKTECNIEPNYSRGYLITVSQLLLWQFNKKERDDADL